MDHRATVALVALVAFLIVPATLLEAQGDGLTPGARIRVWRDCTAPAGSGATQPCGPEVGRLLRIEATGMLIQREGEPPEALPLGSLPRLEVSGGSRHHTLLGLGAGAVVGFGVGMILAKRAGCDHGIFGSNASEDDLCGAYGVVAIPAGAALGAVVGRLIRSERWRPVAGSNTALRFLPGRKRLSLGIGLAF